MRSVARVGSHLRLTVLGPPGTLDGFDTFWEAVRQSGDRFASPESYAHHRFGDPDLLRRLLEGCSWEVHEVRPIISNRRCHAEELWRWLWGSLPIKRGVNEFLEGPEREALEGDVQPTFFQLADRFRDGDEYVINSTAYMAIATALPR